MTETLKVADRLHMQVFRCSSQYVMAVIVRNVDWT